MVRIRKPHGILLFGLLIGTLMLMTPVPASCKLFEDKDLNYVLEVPDDWVRDAATPAWGKFNIVIGAVKELDKLKSGKPPKGQGGQVALAITDAPEGKDLDALAADQGVLGFLMRRFDADPEKWPEIDLVSDAYDTGLEVRILTAKGDSPNLKGKPNTTRAVMLLAIAKGKLYQLRMYAWPTEFDEEAVASDLDFIEVNFDIPDLKEDSKESAEGPPPTEIPDEPQFEGDEGEEKVIEDKVVGWKIVKPIGIKSAEWDRDTYPDAVAWFEGNDRVGSYQIILTVFRRGRVIGGQQVPDVDLRDWITKKWWPVFTANHPDGPLETFKWPKKTESGSPITLPVFEEPKVLAETPKKRPVDPGSTELMKKYKVVEKPKNLKLGRDKTNELYRGSLRGTRPRVGKEIVLRFAWGTARLQCELTVSLARDATQGRWIPAIRKLLESIEMTGRQ